MFKTDKKYFSPCFGWNPRGPDVRGRRDSPWGRGWRFAGWGGGGGEIGISCPRIWFLYDQGIREALKEDK